MARSQTCNTKVSTQRFSHLGRPTSYEKKRMISKLSTARPDLGQYQDSQDCCWVFFTKSLLNFTFLFMFTYCLCNFLNFMIFVDISFSLRRSKKTKDQSCPKNATNLAFVEYFCLIAHILHQTESKISKNILKLKLRVFS